MLIILQTTLAARYLRRWKMGRLNIQIHASEEVQMETKMLDLEIKGNDTLQDIYIKHKRQSLQVPTSKTDMDEDRPFASCVKRIEQK